MPLPTIPGVVRCVIAGSVGGGGRWSNTWHFRRIDLGSASALEIAALHVELSAFYVFFLTGYACSNTLADTADYTPLDGTSGAVSLPLATAGAGVAAGTLPPEVAEVLTIRTADRGRRARGRVFLPAISTGNIADGQLPAVVTNAIVAASATLMAAAVVSGWELGVASYGKSVKTDFTTPRPHTRVVTTWTPYFTTAVSTSMDPKLDVIRSRKQ